jgi:hypothetical protein
MMVFFVTFLAITAVLVAVQYLCFSSNHKTKAPEPEAKVNESC